jgi:hypothetical protein
MPQGYTKIDSIVNDEYQNVVAKKDALVETDVNGGTVVRKVRAGQVVPADLVDDYHEQHGDEDRRPR